MPNWINYKSKKNQINSFTPQGTSLCVSFLSPICISISICCCCCLHTTFQSPPLVSVVVRSKATNSGRSSLVVNSSALPETVSSSDNGRRTTSYNLPLSYQWMKGTWLDHLNGNLTRTRTNTASFRATKYSLWVAVKSFSLIFTLKPASRSILESVRPSAGNQSVERGNPVVWSLRTATQTRNNNNYNFYSTTMFLSSSAVDPDSLAQSLSSLISCENGKFKY